MPNRFHTAAIIALSLASCAKPGGLPPLPQKPVDLQQDDHGITHVRAQSDLDAFYGGGYAIARDRLFQMELLRRQANGTYAEIFGAGYVGSDYGPRMFNFRALGAADYKLLLKTDPQTALLAQAWVAGVNAREAEIRSGKVPRPTGFRATELDFLPEPWTPDDTLAIGKMLAWGLSGTLNQDLLATVLERLVPDTAARFPPALPGFDSFIVPTNIVGPPAPIRMRAPARAPVKADPKLLAWHEAGLPRHSASNNWAVSGALTDSGRPLLAGDPHQTLQSPNVFWPVHLTGGALDVFGFAFPGTFGVQLGMNAHLGWTATVSGADVTDVWDVVVSDDFATASLGGVDVPITTRVEQIRTRLPGQPPASGPASAFTIHEIPGRGVFVPDEVLPIPRIFVSDHQLLMNWTGFAPTTEASAYARMGSATDLAGWEAAAKNIQVGGLNFIAADAHDIAFYAPVQFPDRGTPGTRRMPWHLQDGSDPETFWTHGFLPESKLPHVKNPARGYLVTANNDPFGFTADGNVDNDPWYYGAIFAKGARSFRVEQVLSGWTSSGHKVSRADMEELQGDVHSVTADVFVPAISTAVAAVETDATLTAWRGRTDLAALATQLAAWDRRYDKDSGGAVAFQGLVWFFAKRAFEAKVTGQLFNVVSGSDPALFEAYSVRLLQGQLPDVPFFAPNGTKALLLASLDDTESWLKSRFGTDDLAQLHWRDFHQASFNTIYSPNWERPTASVSGGPDTINVAGARFFGSDGVPVQDSRGSESAAYRMVVGFGADGRTEATIDMPLGSSGEPGEPLATNLESDWEAVRHVAIATRSAEIAAHVQSTVTLPAAK